jgi:hypothetical protein
MRWAFLNRRTDFRRCVLGLEKRMFVSWEGRLFSYGVVMAAGKVQKRLDDSVNLIFRSKNRQIMLSRIHEFRHFSPFYSGREPVQVITSNKTMFLANMHAVEGDNKLFFLDATSERPPLREGDGILLLFQAGRETALSQAVVDGVFGSRVRVNAIDPRTNIRYKTRMRVKWNVVSDECYNRFCQKTIGLSREISIPESMNDVKDIGKFLICDTICELDGTPSSGGKNYFSEHPLNGLCADLSMGGFCMLTENTDVVQKAQENLFVIAEFPMPHVSHDFLLRVAAVVRHIRRLPDRSVVHCMFLERLVPEVFDV